MSIRSFVKGFCSSTGSLIVEQAMGSRVRRVSDSKALNYTQHKSLIQSTLAVA